MGKLAGKSLRYNGQRQRGLFHLASVFICPFCSGEIVMRVIYHAKKGERNV